MIWRIIEPGLSPELTGDLDGVDAGRLPPGSLVAGAMHCTMMDTAERHGEFIAGLAAERARLQVGWCGSDGLRPQMRHGCLATERRCSGLR